MARFRFRLEAVLRHREMIRQQRQRDLAVATAARDEAAAVVRAVDDSTAAALQELRANHLIGRIEVAYLTAHRRFVAGVGRKRIELVEKLTEADKVVETARAAAADAGRAVKVIEKLRDRQKARWDEAASRKELSDADDIAMRMTETTP